MTAQQLATAAFLRSAGQYRCFEFNLWALAETLILRLLLNSFIACQSLLDDILASNNVVRQADVPWKKFTSTFEVP
jgi:hypothetical protein